MGKIELTLLSEGQIWGNEKEEQLEALKKYGTKASITDLPILTGACMRDINMLKGEMDIVFWYWTKSVIFGQVLTVDTVKHEFGRKPSLRTGVIRPVIESPMIFNILFQNSVNKYKGIYEVEFGEYPQYAADLITQKVLKKNYNENKLKETGNSYTFDSVVYNHYGTKFTPITYKEYEYENKRYIRVLANSCYIGEKFILSNGEKYTRGDAVWVQVKPVKWLIDEKQRL